MNGNGVGKFCCRSGFSRDRREEEGSTEIPSEWLASLRAKFDDLSSAKPIQPIQALPDHDEMLLFSFSIKRRLPGVWWAKSANIDLCKKYRAAPVQ